MVFAPLIAAATAAAATASAIATSVVRRQRGFREPEPPVPPARTRPVEEEEREALLGLVGDSLFERLDDAGLWLPDGTSVETLYVPVEQVGGDFLGTAEVDGDAVAFIGDVAGHGIDAAIVAMGVKEQITDAIVEGAELEEAVGQANDLLRTDLPGFATLFACRLRPDGELSFVNAGHVPPLLFDGEPEHLSPTGPMMGAVEHEYDATSCAVEPEARLVAFTDGVTEAFGARGGLTEPEIRAVAAEPGGFVDLAAAVTSKLPEPVRDDIAAFELTVGGTEEEPPHG